MLSRFYNVQTVQCTLYMVHCSELQETKVSKIAQSFVNQIFDYSIKQDNCRLSLIIKSASSDFYFGITLFINFFAKFLIQD